jgi:hypothetical protein
LLRWTGRYGFYYGCSLISQSYTVFYVSLLGHFLQFAFLSFVENPRTPSPIDYSLVVRSNWLLVGWTDIEKIYKDMVRDDDPATAQILYDRTAGYFRRDLVIFKNLHLSRATDILCTLHTHTHFSLSSLSLSSLADPCVCVCVAVVALVIHVTLLFLLTSLPRGFYVIPVILWRLIHSAVLGYVLCIVVVVVVHCISVRC